MKKKEIVAASLVVLIGLAGYLNWSYQDTVRVRDNASYVETGKMLGEAEMVSSNNEAEDDEDEDEKAEDAASGEKAVENTAYFEDAKRNRETARAAAMEALRTASGDSTLDGETRRAAGEKLLSCAENIELESNLENIAAAKGFPEICIYINEGAATVAVRSDGLSADQVAALTDIVTGTASIPAARVKIIEVK